VNDSDSTLECHGDGHFMFRDSVHGTGNKGCLDGYFLGKFSGYVDIVKTEGDVTWHHDEIIVGVGYERGIVHE
jgi:hypothetical protein